MKPFARWICPARNMGEVVPRFEKAFSLTKPVSHAELTITALGVYEASLNGRRISDAFLAPGFTAYEKRLQVQTYDVTDLLRAENTLSVLVGEGWYRGRLFDRAPKPVHDLRMQMPPALTARLTLRYDDGTDETISSDESWTVSESEIRASGLYDGEVCDGTFVPTEKCPVRFYDGPDGTLIPQEGPEVREQESLFAARIFRTPKGETVVDFGQNLTGIVETVLTAHEGETVSLSFGEVLDHDGSFYNANYREALCRYRYVCREGKQVYRPRLTFYGFRYIRVDEFPGGAENVTPETFRAIVLHSEMKRTGSLRCSDPMLNQLFDNIVWGQKGNFLDIPTDCPQRDERMGWTGDAQVFCSTACLQFDCEQFFRKWLNDLAAQQDEDGYVGVFIPDLIHHQPSAAWGDAAVICPWEVYKAYGSGDILRRQYSSMCGWVNYILHHTTKPDLWLGGIHYGDWVGLDAPSGSYKGATRDDFIASAYLAYSTSLVIRAGRILGEDVSRWEQQLQRTKDAFRKEFPTCTTQTECILAAHFGLAEAPQKAADQLAQMVLDAGGQMKTGFVGTPYLLHALSDYGYSDLAYSLLLRREYPSWLYSVSKGATTVWEHWDGIMEDGSFWSTNMNSFNHYAYGAVAQWVFTKAAGIQQAEDSAGYEKVVFAPTPDPRLDFLEAALETRHGRVFSRWKKQEDLWRFEVETPVEAEFTFRGTQVSLRPGSYIFSFPMQA